VSCVKSGDASGPGVRRGTLRPPGTGPDSLRESSPRFALSPPTALEGARRGPGERVSDDPAGAGRRASL